MTTLPLIEVTHEATGRRDGLLLTLPTRCWGCREAARPIVGVLSTDRSRGQDGFVTFDDVALFLAAHVPVATLRDLGVGTIKLRRSRLRPEGYVSNGCIHCDAVLGSFPLHEDLAAFLAEGGALTDLAVARLLA